MKKTDWLLIAAWIAYIAFLGPWLISAPSWIAVGLGFALLLGLGVFTVKRILGYEQSK
jgi:hypothetical protein